MKQPELAERLRTEGVEPLYGAPGEFRRFIEGETERYADVIRISNARIE